MSYWSRTSSFVDIASFIVLCALWAVGGFFIAGQSFPLKHREKLAAGLATGFLLYIILSNLQAQVLTLLIFKPKISA